MLLPPTELSVETKTARRCAQGGPCGGKRAKRKKWGWQPRTLPRHLQRSTIRACGLNFRVRDVAGWTPAALATNITPVSSLYSGLLPQQLPSFICRSPRIVFLPACGFLYVSCLAFDVSTALFSASPHGRYKYQGSRPLVRVSFTHCCASTSRLSSLSSSSGLSGISSRGGLPT